MSFRLLFVALAVGSCQRDRASRPPSTNTIPFSCAAFPRELSEADLVERFGAENVRSGPATGSDDGPSNGTIVTPNGGDATAQILWRDTTARRGPARVWAKTGKAWRTPNGLSLGMKLKAIEQENGKPFRLHGFRNEVSGTVVSWEGGRLESPTVTDCTLTVRLYPEPETDDPRVVNEVASLDYSSAHAAMQKLDPPIVALILTYPR